jgi:hypothetical protein
MDAGAGTIQPCRRSLRRQFSLRGLIFFVLAAGVSGEVVRSARDVWGNRVITPASTQPGTSTPVPAGWSPLPDDSIRGDLGGTALSGRRERGRC